MTDELNGRLIRLEESSKHIGASVDNINDKINLYLEQIILNSSFRNRMSGHLKIIYGSFSGLVAAVVNKYLQ